MDADGGPGESSSTRGQASVEIYRSVNRRYAWRVIAVAEDDSPESLREAKALALTVEAELHADLAERYGKPRSTET